MLIFVTEKKRLWQIVQNVVNGLLSSIQNIFVECARNHSAQTASKK